MANQDSEHGDRALRPDVAPVQPKSPNALCAAEAYAFWQGMRDHPRTLGTSFLAGFLGFFGIEPRPYFLNGKLEAVRRLTICIRHGLSGRLATELELARRAGVTENQIAALRSRIGRSAFASG